MTIFYEKLLVIYLTIDLIIYQGRRPYFYFFIGRTPYTTKKKNNIFCQDGYPDLSGPTTKKQNKNLFPYVREESVRPLIDPTARPVITRPRPDPKPKTEYSLHRLLGDSLILEYSNTRILGDSLILEYSNTRILEYSNTR